MSKPDEGQHLPHGGRREPSLSPDHWPPPPGCCCGPALPLPAILWHLGWGGDGEWAGGVRGGGSQARTQSVFSDSIG